MKGTHTLFTDGGPDPNKISLPVGEYLVKVKPNGAWAAVEVDETLELPRFWRDAGNGLFLVIAIPFMLLLAPFALFGLWWRRQVGK